MGILLKLLKIFPVVANGIAEKTNGKKTIIGFSIAAAGAAMLFVPLLEPMAVDTIIAGAVVAMGGAAHKIVKAKGRKGNGSPQVS